MRSLWGKAQRKQGNRSQGTDKEEMEGAAFERKHTTILQGISSIDFHQAINVPAAVFTGKSEKTGVNQS